jgi:hypothetical protein
MEQACVTGACGKHRRRRKSGVRLKLRVDGKPVQREPIPSPVRRHGVQDERTRGKGVER